MPMCTCITVYLDDAQMINVTSNAVYRDGRVGLIVVAPNSLSSGNAEIAVDQFEVR